MLTYLLIGWKMKVCLVLWLGAAFVLCSRRFSPSRLRKASIAIGGISFLLLTALLANSNPE
ncbi:MAG: hypothetical protein HY290_25275 [Planctomycetia bacterium]|nr:hypothetical protein [Planctomycetia bacterium]